MKSGLEGRNNGTRTEEAGFADFVSMKSGLEGRNNLKPRPPQPGGPHVSMKSGLEGRNNSLKNFNDALNFESQ